MKAALVILLFTIFIGFCTWILDRFFSKRLRIYGDHVSESKEEDDADDAACCGLHDVCEKDLLTPLTDEFEYYDDEELDAFLFSLGCYAGEPITVVSRRKGGCTVSIKDGRYNIDNQLAEAIIV